MTAKEKILHNEYDNVIVYENPSYDDALVGVTYSTEQAVYDFDLMVEYLMKLDGISYEDAADYILYNYTGGNDYPIIMFKLIE